MGRQQTPFVIALALLVGLAHTANAQEVDRVASRNNADTACIHFRILSTEMDQLQSQS
jgi:hypothetical protein